MKIVFAGTSEFGIPTLEKLKDQLVLIITQPDKPAGRDKKLTPPPIKLWAEKHGLPIEQPDQIKSLETRFRTLEPDLLLVAAYGQIIPSDILNIPKFGSINIHGSLLPKYRGASPIQTALLNGDKESGITLLKMDEKMDHGPIIAKQALVISADDTFTTLYKKLSLLASELTPRVLTDWLEGKINPTEQDHSRATFTKLLTRSDGKIDWSRPAAEIHNQIRALNPEPGTWTTLSGKTVKILETEILSDHKIELPGKLYVTDGKLAVKTLDNGLIIKKIKPEGKNEMSGRDFANGLQSLTGKIFV